MRKFNSMKEHLTRDELRSISGGLREIVTGNCTYYCGNGTPIPNAPNCNAEVATICRNNEGSNFGFCTCN